MDFTRGWHNLPRIYRILLIIFLTLDLIILALMALGLQSWLYAAGAIVISTAFLFILYALSAPAQGRASEPTARRTAGITNLVLGAALLIVGAWATLGLLVEVSRGTIRDNISEGVALFMGLLATGTLLLNRGRKMRSTGAPNASS